MSCADITGVSGSDGLRTKRHLVEERLVVDCARAHEVVRSKWGLEMVSPALPWMVCVRSPRVASDEAKLRPFDALLR